MVEHRLIERLLDAHLQQRRIIEAVGRIIGARRIAHHDGHNDILALRYLQLLAHGGATFKVDICIILGRVQSQRFQRRLAAPVRGGIAHTHKES